MTVVLHASGVLYPAVSGRVLVVGVIVGTIVVVPITVPFSVPWYMCPCSCVFWGSVSTVSVLPVFFSF